MSVNPSHLRYVIYLNVLFIYLSRGRGLVLSRPMLGELDVSPLAGVSSARHQICREADRRNMNYNLTFVATTILCSHKEKTTISFESKYSLSPH